MLNFSWEGKLKHFLVLFMVLVLCAGCAKLKHLDQLLTLKRMSDEGDKTDLRILFDLRNNRHLVLEIK